MSAPHQALFMIDFKPTHIAGCVAWYDASDTATITTAGSPAKVTQWNDKSATGFNVQEIDAGHGNSPTSGSETQNGRNVLVFDGSDDVLVNYGTTPGLLQSVSGWTIFTAAKTTTNSSGTQQASCRVHTGGATTLSRAFGFEVTATNGFGQAGGRRNDADSSAVATMGVAVGTSFCLMSAVASYTGTTLTLYKNGTQVAQNASWLTSGTTPATGGSISIGAFQANGTGLSSPWSGQIGEVLIYNLALSAGSQAVIEAYLKQKWGL